MGINWLTIHPSIECPIGINTYLFAQRYNALVAPTAAAVVLSIGLSFISLSLILLLIGVR
jgi:predicted permease